MTIIEYNTWIIKIKKYHDFIKQYESLKLIKKSNIHNDSIMVLKIENVTYPFRINLITDDFYEFLTMSINKIHNEILLLNINDDVINNVNVYTSILNDIHLYEIEMNKFKNIPDTVTLIDENSIIYENVLKNNINVDPIILEFEENINILKQKLENI